MRGQFYRDGALSDDGKTIQVSGPVDWESDELGAVIHATLTQPQPDNATADGFSIFTPATSDSWFATLTVRDGKIFRRGAAGAVGDATVSIKDNKPDEQYQWPDQVILHDGKEV
jgi:hypothetical protein